MFERTAPYGTLHYLCRFCDVSFTRPSNEVDIDIERALDEIQSSIVNFDGRARPRSSIQHKCDEKRLGIADLQGATVSGTKRTSS